MVIKVCFTDFLSSLDKSTERNVLGIVWHHTPDDIDACEAW